MNGGTVKNDIISNKVLAEELDKLKNSRKERYTQLL